MLGASNVGQLAQAWDAGLYYSPVIANGVVYATGGEFSDTLAAISARSGTVIWTATMGGDHGGTDSIPAVAGGIVYAGDLGGLHAFDAATGAQLWRFRPARGCGSPQTAWSAPGSPCPRSWAA